MSTVKATNFSHPSAANPAIVLDAAGGATVAGMGLVLVSPTSIANSGGSASASGGAVTFTGVSSVSLNGVFTSAYDNYRIVLNGSTSATSVALHMRYRASGTDETASVYKYGEIFISTTTVGFQTGSGSATQGLLASIYSSGRYGVAADLYRPNLNTEKTLGFNSPAADNLFSGFTRCTSTTQFDGITIYPASGDITGTIRVYGYKNS